MNVHSSKQGVVTLVSTNLRVCTGQQPCAKITCKFVYFLGISVIIPPRMERLILGKICISAGIPFGLYTVVVFVITNPLGASEGKFNVQK